LTVFQYRVLVVLGALALALAIVNAVMFSNNRQAQNELATRGQYIQQSLQLEPLYQSLIKSLADLAAKDNDAQLRDLLASQGISFSANPQPAPAR
jgi:flagellar basal body-associated protein FliL